MADCPVVRITWHQALAFAQWARCTLPSELETEYAGRGVESWEYPWGNQYDSKRVVDDKDPTYGDKNPAPVTYKPEGASWVGAMQSSGNVWEWQRSLYTGYPYQAQDWNARILEIILVKITFCGVVHSSILPATCGLLIVTSGILPITTLTLASAVLSLLIALLSDF
ncbi:MAG UNVERIFIED_CONTAM: formylglycine-generating enzyme family protein [Anaerolineae bacterium]|jgi:hypothetical protein